MKLALLTHDLPPVGNPLNEPLSLHCTKHVAHGGHFLTGGIA